MPRQEPELGTGLGLGPGLELRLGPEVGPETRVPRLEDNEEDGMNMSTTYPCPSAFSSNV